MISPEITQIKQALEQIRALNLAEKLAKQFSTVDLNQHSFGNFTAAQLINLTERLVNQFNDELDSPNAALLPKGFHWDMHPYGMRAFPIAGVIGNLASQLSGNDWNGACLHLELAIGYQIQNGFWDRSTKKLQSISKLRQADLFSNLEAKAAQLKELLVVIGNLKTEYEQSVRQRQADVQAAAQQLSTAQSQVGEITKLLTKSTGENGQLTEILNNQNANLEKTKAELKAIDDRKIQLEATLKDAAARLTSSEGRLKFMEDKAKWVNELAGTAAAGVLGKKFEARKRELAKSSNKWLAGTIASVVMAAAWLGVAHTYFMHDGPDVWRTLALNFGLLLPAIFIVGFFANQFGKVRHFEEEYAFRAAVAMTMSAFADRLKMGDDGHDKLIAETVEKLYQLPVLLKEHEPRGWFAQRNAERMVKNVTELVAAVKQPPKP